MRYFLRTVLISFILGFVILFGCKSRNFNSHKNSLTSSAGDNKKLRTPLHPSGPILKSIDDLQLTYVSSETINPQNRVAYNTWGDVAGPYGFQPSTERTNGVGLFDDGLSAALRSGKITSKQIKAAIEKMIANAAPSLSSGL